MLVRSGSDRTFKMFLVTEKITHIRTVDIRAEQAAHLMNPKSSNSSFIAISFPELSLAFAMLKVAKMDAKVSHSCSDGVSSALRNLMSTDGFACKVPSNASSVSS